MKSLMGNPHIPSVYPNETKYSTKYGQWLKGFDWTYIMTLRKHIPLTEAACQKVAKSLLNYSDEVQTIWMALEQDRGDSMNHLHLILETGQMTFKRHEMIEALGVRRHPKTLSYFSPVDSSDAVAMYCSKRIGGRLQFHDFYSQTTK
ncbi:hypothetical protein N9F17_02235 [Salibacteraceae bacterium]|nr:hypothetical protein [Salibacteraceae bacterium]